MSDTASNAAPLTIPGEDRKEYEPGPALRRMVRAAFVMRKDPPRSLHEWCRTQEPPVAWSNANNALLHLESEEGRALRKRILIAAGLIEEKD